MPGDHRGDRQTALLALLDAHGLDALLVSHRPNVRYLTGFSGSAGYAVVSRHETLLVTDFRYDTQARTEARGVARVAIERSNVWERVWREIDALGGITNLGYEAHVLPAREEERLARTAADRAWRGVPTVDLVERLRLRKDSDEIAAIRAAAALTEEALRRVWPCVQVGQTELEVAGQLERELRRQGSEEHPFPVIVASGARSALPHARASRRAIQRGDLLLIDCGATVDGYCADLTRTVVVGAPASDSQRTLYALVRGAQNQALQGLRAGMTGREADALAREVIAARGFGDAFGHSLGHGLGLEVHEGPRVAETNTESLPADAVVTVEPGVYLPDQGGVRLEDDVHLTTAGATLLSDGAPELLSLT